MDLSLKDNELLDLYQKARDAYYKTGETVMPDSDFDDLEDELKKRNLIENVDSVGNDEIDGFPKAKHTILMGSQAKANTLEEVADWLSKQKCKSFIAEPKCDGISLELNYIDGELVSAITRGNGYIGDDITNNAKKMTGVPSALTKPFSGAIRGEILLFHEDKEKYFPEMKNCRNAASGIVKRLDGSGSEYLTLVVYDIQNLDENKKFSFEDEKMDYLSTLGKDKPFIVNFFNKIKQATAQDLMDFMNNTTMNLALQFDIDGVVIKSEIVDNEDLRISDRPKSQIAIKPARVEKKTVLRAIEWQMANDKIVPVGVFDPVEFDGATCSRASLSNIAQLEELGIEVGDEIFVSRRNMVIPHIERKC